MTYRLIVEKRILLKIQNGNMESPPALDPTDVKVVIIGEPRCGKTSFIRAFYNNHFPEETYSHNAVRAYPCKFTFNSQQQRIVLFEIPSHPEILLPQRKAHYLNASVYVFLYAFDNPSSLQMLTDKWIPESVGVINLNNKPLILVGNKRDLKNDSQVLERLAIENQAPITDEQVLELFDQFRSRMLNLECCSHDVEDVEEAFTLISQFYILDLLEKILI